MLTKEEIDNAYVFHQNGCYIKVGPRGGKKAYVIRFRRSGKTQYWKTRPDDFRIPIVRGLYDHWEITPQNVNLFHSMANCPIITELFGSGSED